ncbi:MAG: CHAT domain-containing protein [Eubacteriaceae bacterium]|nr:CHAT domain-containing protein [Eubacteriaceae bacterium]
MQKNSLPSEFKDKYLDLKSKRDFCLKNGAFILAFFHQVQINEFYNSIPQNHQKREDIADHYQIAKVIVQDCFDNTDECLFDYLYSDVAVALGYNTSLRNIPNYDYMISAFYSHINTIKFLYMVKSPNEVVKQYVDNLLSAYGIKYGQQNDIYLKLCLHLLYEGIWFYDSEYALSLFNDHYDRFISCLMGYGFTYEVVLVTANVYIEMENFDIANKLLDVIERSIQQLSDVDKQKNFKLQCTWRRAKILSMQGYYLQSEECCSNLLKSIGSSHPIFPEICGIMMANCVLTGKSGSKWIIEGILSCKKLNYTQSITYFRLLGGLASEEYFKGNIADAINYAREVLDGIESITGKESNIYVMALITYFSYLDNEKAQKDFLDDIFDTILELNSPGSKALAYSIMASLGYNRLGKETHNVHDLEQVARDAVKASDSYHIEYLRIATRLDLLHKIVGQIDRYSSLENEIAQLFSFLEIHKSKMDTHQSYIFRVCYIIYYCNHGQTQRALTIVADAKQNIAAIAIMPKLLRYLDRMHIEVLLANHRELEAIAELKSQIENIASLLQKANDLTSIAEYLRFALSVVSQYGQEKEYFSDLSYKCALMLKYINVKFQPDFNRSEANLDISRQISALELRKTSVDSLMDNNDIQNELQALRYKLNYSSDKYFRLPSLKDIYLERTSVLLDVCLFGEYKHGDFVYHRDEEEGILDIKLAAFVVYSDRDGCQQIKRLNDIDLDSVSKVFDSDNEGYTQSDLRCFYDIFFRQFEQYLDDKDTLYLSLDYRLSVIPFEALLDRNNITLVDKYNFINVLVASDIRADFNVSLRDALLMGNPRYGIYVEYVNEIDELPYSEIEVNLIESLVESSKKYLREKATKDAFYQNLGSNIIHLSSHGCVNDFTPDALQTPLIVSTVLFSGFLDFVDNNKVHGYGNGLLTAEDVISLNLGNTDLVVLSACESGLGYFSDSISIPKGLRWAIGFTGAKASITSIYEVSDFATAVFMVLFYRNLKNLPVARAMNEAKKQMRNLTVRDIRSDSIIYNTFRNEAQKQLRDLKSEDIMLDKYFFDRAFSSEFSGWSEDDKLFASLEYWNAFDCYFYGGILP